MTVGCGQKKKKYIPVTCWKRPWCWGRLRARGEGDGRGWDGWMASLTPWTRVWASSGGWWRTGKPGVLQAMGSQRGATGVNEQQPSCSSVCSYWLLADGHQSHCEVLLKNHSLWQLVLWKPSDDLLEGRVTSGSKAAAALLPQTMRKWKRHSPLFGFHSWLCAGQSAGNLNRTATCVRCDHGWGRISKRWPTCLLYVQPGTQLKEGRTYSGAGDGYRVYWGQMVHYGCCLNLIVTLIALILWNQVLYITLSEI